MKRIVVVGAGFGGLKTFRQLDRRLKHNSEVELMLINDVNYFLFTPLLHEVATGSLFPENIVVPLPPIAAGPRRHFFVGQVESVSLSDRLVYTNRGAVPFDYLVLALGSTTNFYQTPGAAEYTLTLKDLDDAARIKNQIINQFEKAQCLPEAAARRRALTFVIVGGGPTGVELAGELADFGRQTFAKIYPALAQEFKIFLIQKDQTILPQFSAGLRRRSLTALGRRGMEVLVNTGVENISSQRIDLAGGQHLEAETFIWTAGVKPRTVIFDRPVKTVNGRLAVNKYLQLVEEANVFALGDLAASFDEKKQSYLPALAQVADRQAKTAAFNLANLIANRSLKTFRYRSRGSLLSLGAWWGAGEIFGFHFTGRLTWLLWRGVYWSKMPTWEKRLQILIDWLVIAFSPRDVSLLPFTQNDLHR